MRIFSGGEGSGCNPDVGKCGRPSVNEDRSGQSRLPRTYKDKVKLKVKEYANKHGAGILALQKQDSINRQCRTNKNCTPIETIREKLFKELGFSDAQIDKLTYNMISWKSAANGETRDAAREILSGKPKSDLAKLWYVEHKITQSILGDRKIVLYRGVTGSQADELLNTAKSGEGAKTLFKLKLSPANSWTDDPNIAKVFGSVYLRKKMPTKYIMTSYITNGIFKTQFASEREFLCMTPEKGVSMKRSGAIKASSAKVVTIDLTDKVNDNWLRSIRKGDNHNTMRIKVKDIKSAADKGVEEFRNSLQAHSANDGVGTEKTGYALPDLGPFECEHCIHASDGGTKCDHKEVLSDKDVPKTKDQQFAVIHPKSCCNYFHPIDS